MGVRDDGDAQSYLSCGRGFAYLSLIMDAFSRKAECRPIVGWSLQKKLDAKGPILALKMVLQSRTKASQFIHHRSGDPVRQRRTV